MSDTGAPTVDRAPLVFLVAGEPSGDVLGARLMAALRRLTGGHVRFAGVGGEAMRREGLASLFPLDDLAVMGFVEILPRLPRILSRLRDVERAVIASRPAVVVTIDAPGFNLRLARRLRPQGVRLVHYVAPQLWAWRPERARKLIGLFDRILTLFPFETAFFAGLGIDTRLVGHPAVEAERPEAGDLRARLGIAPSAPVLLMLPGSRVGLVRRMLPIYAATAKRLALLIPGLVILVPVVAATRAVTAEAVAAWPVDARVVDNLADKRAALAAAAAAITISGTSTLELALAGMPMIVAYRTNPISAFLARRLVRVPHVALPNLILGRGAIPELLQEACTPGTLADAAARLMIDATAAQSQRDDLAALRAQLGADGLPPSERAARAVLEVIGV
jgi:lipid-A-disaccharide synthase